MGALRQRVSGFLAEIAYCGPKHRGILRDLTTREREVLELVAHGLDNHKIGARLGISERTVRNNVSIILSKLGVKSCPEAIVRAFDAGLGQKSGRT